MSLELSALFEMHRQQVLLNAKDHNGEWRMPPAYVYAVGSRMFPFFHQEWCRGDDPFASLYDPDEAFMSEVITYLDDLWIKRETIPTFYQLEDKFGRGKRGGMIRILRYSFLNEGFDPDFYSALLKPMEHPSEAGGLSRPMEDWDLLLL